MFHVFCNQDVADVLASDLREQLSIPPSAGLQVRSRIAAIPLIFSPRQSELFLIWGYDCDFVKEMTTHQTF